MRRMILVTVFAWLAISGILLAADADASKLKTLRTGVINKIPALNDAFDNEHNGAADASRSMSVAYQAGLAALQKHIADENAKAADVQDKTAIAAWQAKSIRFQTLWTERNQKSWPAWRQKFEALSTIRLNLASLVGAQANLDQTWVRANCNLSVFIAVFTELDKQVDDVTTQAKALVEESVKECADDERLYKDNN